MSYLALPIPASKAAALLYSCGVVLSGDELLEAIKAITTGIDEWSGIPIHNLPVVIQERVRIVRAVLRLPDNFIPTVGSISEVSNTDRRSLDWARLRILGPGRLLAYGDREYRGGPINAINLHGWCLQIGLNPNHSRYAKTWRRLDRFWDKNRDTTLTSLEEKDAELLGLLRGVKRYLPRPATQ